MEKIISDNYNSMALVDMWADFIDWKKRRQGEDGFLKKTLLENNCQRIFEACLGDGCDTIYLLKEGFEVTSNDLDLLFIKKAQENARREKVKLNITSYDWRELGKHFEKSFDAVICLGNSLTYLFDEKDRLKTLTQFRKMLVNGGILIIDERNYQYILDNNKAILKGDFRYSANYVYCGNKVHGTPIEITPEKVVFEYSDTARKRKARLELYPFKRGELLNLLKKAGFKKISQYSDYKKTYSKNADFYQYVAIT
ncbi:MAG: class I SAM-dependent methyltransferase [archaeon]|nr:class I SAM-dependent methyltransferase [archaeon]